ncbi:hypothetical protein [Pseudorhodobacter sp.]|uniref:hypothetical protein n=1 Tax=Pseudorhodobacter sp. TaxID=1934400 RepID=UPI002AFF1900|nr:hypothetical protein [Pseudorhodobacter sp.]
MDLPEITLEPVEWSPRVEGWLHKIAGVERHIEAIAMRVKAANQALSIRANGVESGMLVYSVELEPRGAVLVANALAGRFCGVDLTVLCLNVLTEMGRAVGAVAVRYWTDRRGLVRKCEKMGLESRYVLALRGKNLNG